MNTMDPVRVAEQESLALATQRGGKQSRKMARRLKRAAALTEASAEALTQSVDQFFTSVGRGSSAWASVNYRALAGIPVGQQPSVASARERDAARSEADTLSVAGSLSARGPRSVAGSVRSHAASVHASVHASGAATAREARLATASDAGAAGPRSNHTGQRMVESFEKDMLSSVATSPRLKGFYLNSPCGHRGAICMAVPCIPSININQILAEQAAAAALLAPPLRPAASALGSPLSLASRADSRLSRVSRVSGGGEDPSGVVRTTLKMMQRQKASQEMATLVQEHGAARVDPNYAPHGFQAGKARASSAGGLLYRTVRHVILPGHCSAGGRGVICHAIQTPVGYPMDTALEREVSGQGVSADTLIMQGGMQAHLLSYKSPTIPTARTHGEFGKMQEITKNKGFRPHFFYGV